MRRLVYILPVLVLIALALFFVRRLQLIERGNLPDFIPSVMISKPVPTFALTSLFEGKADLSSEKLKNQVTLVNVFASWCVDCRREHPVLDSVKQAGIP